ncbi:MAG: ABC transporter substrate-binding protein, partial [Alphaproteobacteria bacterium]|nr:ABC transporter substrate-binding protein [Alphaproteobacteria bacterium]
LCLQDDIRRAGFDPAAMNREAGRSMAENADALREGRVDAIQVFEPFVEELVHEGAGHVWYAAASRGPTSYTTLYTSRRFAEDNPGTLSALAGGVMDALTWLHGHDANVLAERLQGYFPDLAPARLAGAVARYKANGVWGRDPVLPLEGFVRLKGALISGGFVARDIPFEACVDNRHAKRARDGR